MAGVQETAGRAVSRDSARAQVVRATAARLFEASGYAGTTMNDIADAVGLLPGSLYHHFASKEQIAAELLTAYSTALGEVADAAVADPPAPGAAAEERVRQLSADVMALSFEHAAAVRLRAFDPPTVATARLREAMRLPTEALEIAWRDAVDGLRPAREGGADPALLRFALQQATLDGPGSYPSGQDPREVAARLCDVLLQGVTTGCPHDGELDGSAASRAAVEALAGWPEQEPPAGPRDRDTIVSAARAEFARRGYDATTVRDIAAAAGVRMGTLYRRVESKEALLREILGSYSGHLGEAFGAVLAAGSPEVETLDGLARVFVHASRRFEAETCIVRYGWSGREATTSPFHDYYLATQGRLTALEELIDRGAANGRLRTVPDMALHIRSVLWLPFHQHARTGTARAHAFLRAALLRGALRG
ncbi:TetR/AcrR family transcriptional regulator [Blastococcus sp. URHD0036]|uniref:TetR/AcrR family transcriptional regulator n=1 Tax=Blastococcus sp. URHD0036 TaxID=1380356 RepID=UPI000690FB9A|nr:TetR/AcrR family transcriptional regulator [Blastococcus sp. URHD0036]